MERLVLQRVSVDAGWQSATEDPVSMRIIPFKKADLAETRLVDGGRWLLASAFGTVMVYDLDDPRDEGKILIPRYADAHENLRTTALNVDILKSASTLTFNLAISQDLPGYDYIPEDPPLWTHIWRVTLNGHGTGAQLQAMHLMSFTPPGDLSAFRSASLYGDRYTRGLIYPGVGPCVEIYDWTASSSKEHRKTVISERCDRLQLLSHDQILIFEGNDILLCDIPALETCLPSSRHPGSIIIPCRSISLPGTKFLRGGPSQLRSSSSMCYEFVSATDAGIFAVKLSATASSAHILHAIGDEERVIDVLVGARRVYIRFCQFAEAFSYRTEQIGGSGVEYRTTPPRERFIPQEYIAWFEPQMDEASGRIAMAASSYAIGVFYYSQFDKYKLFIS
ncbi:hypothetical protein HWV62_21693 [Athelia sp. TMB]|nr:hypothetical protein HWV62_21693 [Athelia sp. TMB]